MSKVLIKKIGGKWRILAKPAEPCTSSDKWNCKYYRKADCKAFCDPQNYGSAPVREVVEVYRVGDVAHTVQTSVTESEIVRELLDIIEAARHEIDAGPKAHSIYMRMGNALNKYEELR